MICQSARRRLFPNHAILCPVSDPFSPATLPSGVDHAQLADDDPPRGRKNGPFPAGRCGRITVRARVAIPARCSNARNPESKFLLFELDPEFCRDLERQFADDPRVTVIQARLRHPARRIGQAESDALRLHSVGYPVQHHGGWQESGKFSRKRTIRIVPGGDFVIYQVTNELRGHATPTIFPRGGQRVFPGQRAADVHHRVPQGRRAREPAIKRPRQPWANGSNGHHRQGQQKPHPVLADAPSLALSSFPA